MAKNNRFKTKKNILIYLVCLVFYLILIINSSILIVKAEENKNLESIISSSKSLIMELNLNYEFDIEPINQFSREQFVKSTLSLFPKNEIYQEILEFSTYPKANISDVNLVFQWRNPEFGNYKYGLNSVVKTLSIYTEFKSQPHFPININNKDLIKYTKPSKHIDSNHPLIREKASMIVKGETDLFSAVYEIAKWVKENVDYDLNTLTAEVSQKSSWVLENRYGVCDEITNLFIGLNRAVGIPSRFISGLSYTNTGEFANSWGLHGWAEVYFPNIGWIPFDVTYGQYGYIDPSHIKLFQGIDQENSSTRYKYYGVDLITKGITYDVNLIEHSGNFIEPISMKAEAIKKEVGFGSYNLIELEIENNGPYYIPLKIHIIRSSGIELLGNQTEEILLYPKDKTIIFFRFKVDEDLNNRFTYTFPIHFMTEHGNIEKVNFSSSQRSPFYPYEEFELYKNIKTLTYKLIPQINLTCSKGKDFFYLIDKPYFYCEVKNIGNVPLNNLKICLDECFDFELTISESKTFKMNILNPSIGNFQKMIYVSGDTYSSSKANISIFDKPKIKIKNIIYPKEVNYSEIFSIDFSIQKESFSDPLNVEITITDSINQFNWDFEKIDIEKNFSLKVDSSGLKKISNFEIKIKYTDLKNNTYFESKSFQIEIINLNYREKLNLLIYEIIIIIEKYIILSTIFITLIIFFILILILNTSKIKLDKEKEKLKKETLKELIKDSEKQIKEDKKHFK